MIDEEAQSGRHSAQIYLRVAEAVLGAARSPLSAREIVERGIERGLFGDHVLGLTPEKSMQARLSLDIKHLRAASRFMRVARGRFLLRGHRSEAQKLEESAASSIEYIAEARKLRMPAEQVLCVPEGHYHDILTFQGIDGEYHDILSKLFKGVAYINRSEAENRNDAKQFITYVLVQCGHRLLSFRRSHISRAAEFLRGSKCIGFGGHVSDADRDIFSSADHGIESCARRELSEELSVGQPGDDRFAPARIQTSLFRDAPIECLGVLNDDSSEVGRRHVAVVYRLWVNDWQVGQLIHKGESSVKSLQWIDLTKNKIDITEYEYWSQLCLRRVLPSSIISEPVIKHLNFRALRRARALVIAGRIGSGKSETSQFLAKRLNAGVISSGNELQQLMQAPRLQEIGRVEFQRRAEEFIRTPRGPELLARRIAEAAAAMPESRIVIDGIRQPETYDALSVSMEGQTTLIYVNTPPDIAYEMYRLRESSSTLDVTYRDFLKVYDAPVENDLPTLGRLAHTYIYNFLGVDALRRSLDKLVLQLS